MRNFKTKFTLVCLVAAMLAGFAAPAAAAPAFNTFPISYASQPPTNFDLPMIDAKNVTTNGSFSANQADHDNGSPAAANDIIEFQIYYHNSGVPDDIARNVIVRAILPGGTRSAHEVSASISSENTGTATPTTGERGGNITINIAGNAQTLDFIPGSVKWFPNHSTAQAALNNADNLVTSGVSIGDIRGCFEFSGFVVFRARVGSAQAAERNLTIEKNVLNVTSGETSFRGNTSAAPGDKVRYQIIFRTTGNASQDSVTLKDILPAKTTFASGSIKIDNNPIGGDGNLFSSAGRNFGVLAANTTVTVTFEATLDGTSSFSAAQTLTNTARVSSDQIGTKEAGANVSVSQVTDSRNLAIKKRVLNVTNGETAFADSTAARPGDRIRFQIRVETSGQGAQGNVIVRDLLPSRLAFVSGTLQMDNIGATSSFESDFFGSGRNIGGVASGSVKILTFEATVGGAGLFSGSTTLVNTANVRSDEVATRQSEAQVNVTLAVAAAIASAQSKTAFNLTKNADATTVPADPGDVITYVLKYRNTGSTTITGAVIEDNIADILELAAITNQGGAVSVNGVIRYAPVDIHPGVEITRTFEVKVRDASLFPASSDLVMVNIYGNEVRVIVRRPGAPRPQVLGVQILPPRTGSDESLAVFFAAMTTFGYWLLRRRLAY